MQLGTAPPERSGRTALPDGRALAWSEWGDPRDRPVLLCPGAATGRSLGFGTHLLRLLGLRLVSVDRPGLGASDPLPGRTLADFAADVRDLCAARSLGRPHVVGNSQGAPFAFACAVAGVARSLTVVSAADEVALVPDALPDGPKAMVGLVASDPEEASRLLEGMGPEAMWDMVTAASPASDLAVYRAPAFESAYRGAMAEAFAQGTAGYARDTVLAMSPWGLALDGITVPVGVWYGEQDTSHSPDNGDRLARRVPGARRRIVPGIGGAVLWTHAERILRALPDAG
ncbi:MULTISPECIES: alpha/beta fold hydrolase [Nocardiopsidaceae]|uniref:Alpha/beta hydrolase n=1 Tax=Streptomonospora nanhaiensis TaxID=1323731 RepID=A0ABY6YJY1_9ACTN|nr:alpha/beta hydrolase [Streptomonospora nanhaiensis]WAE72501.1 alpha/beta hydrolase [Streptomonospora nanhaiensis]